MLRAGLIGCGYISIRHIQSIAKLPEVKLAAVSDVREDQMIQAVNNYQQLIQETDDIAMYGDYHHILLDPKIDFVIIAVYSGLHAVIAKDALKKGKHVIVEKPLALSLADADEIINLSKQNNKKVLVCHQLRYLPHIRKMKEVIRQQKLGEVSLASISIRINRTDDYFANSSWKGTWEKDGGMLVNQGVHLVDLLVWLMGYPVEIYGEIAGRQKYKEIEDIASGIVSFTGQRKGIIEANAITQPVNLGYGLALFGEKGTICIGGKGMRDIIHCYCKGHPELENHLRQGLDTSEEHTLMYRDFLQAIKQNRQPLVSAEEGKKALEMIFALYHSSLIKQPTPFPLKDFNSKEMTDWSPKGGEVND